MNSYIVGSKMLGLENCHDVDRIYFGDASPNSMGEDHIVIANVALIKSILLKFDDPNRFSEDFNRPICVHYFQLSKCFHPEDDYPIDYDIRDHKDGWKQILKNHITHEEAEKYYILSDSGICRKNLYNIAYQYYMLLDDVVWVTGEHLEIIQKIHDLQMPAEYFYKLREQILAL